MRQNHIYAAVTLNTKNPNFTTSIIITGGETYAIYVSDITQAIAFVKKYPADISDMYPPEFPDAIFDEIVGYRAQFGESIQSRTEAISLVLDKHDSGIILMKLDSDGKFKPFRLKENINPDGSKTYIFVPC